MFVIYEAVLLETEIMALTNLNYIPSICVVNMHMAGLKEICFRCECQRQPEKGMAYPQQYSSCL